jgi:hypothetical protein
MSLIVSFSSFILMWPTAKIPLFTILPMGEPGSSVSIVSGYGLDDREIEVRSPTEAKDFSSILCVQTGSGAHPVSCTMGTGGPFPGVKRGRGVTLTTHPHLVPRSRMSRSYSSSFPSAFVACSGPALALLYQRDIWTFPVIWKPVTDENILRTYAPVAI